MMSQGGVGKALAAILAGAVVLAVVFSAVAEAVTGGARSGKVR